MLVHIGNKIKATVLKRGMSVSEFGRRINTSRENVYSIFKRKTIDTGLLITISKILEFDFFEIYSPQIKKLKDENQDLKDYIKLLKVKP